MGWLVQIQFNSHVRKPFYKTERSYNFLHENFSTKDGSDLVPGKFLNIVDQDLSDSKSGQLHVRHPLVFAFMHLRYSCIDSSEMIGNSREVSDFNCRFSLDIDLNSRQKLSLP
jgi:hypothetical protein